MPVDGGKRQAKYHPSIRRKVIASAEVKLLQVQVIDKNGMDRPVLVWMCGPDIIVGETMDALFDAQRRIQAPRWMVEGLQALPDDRKFDYLGRKVSDLLAGERTVLQSVVDDIADTDDDLPEAEPA